MAGKPPSKGTPADMRLKRNNPNAGKGKAGPAKQPGRVGQPKPKFGSPEWDARYGIKPFGSKKA